MIEGPTRLIEEQHEPQAIGQIGFAGEIYSWIGHGRYAHATYKAERAASAITVQGERYPEWLEATTGR